MRGEAGRGAFPALSRSCGGRAESRRPVLPKAVTQPCRGCALAPFPPSSRCSGRPGPQHPCARSIPAPIPAPVPVPIPAPQQRPRLLLPSQSLHLGCLGRQTFYSRERDADTTHNWSLVSYRLSRGLQVTSRGKLPGNFSSGKSKESREINSLGKSNESSEINPNST